MTWSKGDDGMLDHPKITALSDAAYRLWWNAILWSGKHLTDGLLLERNVRALLALQDPPHDEWVAGAEAYFEDLVSELTKVLEGYEHGLWAPCSVKSGHDAWRIHDYLVYNPSRKEVLERREERREAGRRGGRAKAQAQARAKATATDETTAGATPLANPNVLPRPDPPPSLGKEGGEGASESDPEPEGARDRSDLTQIIVDKAQAIGCYRIVLNAYSHLDGDRLLELLEDAGNEDGLPTENLTRALREEPGFPMDLLPKEET